MTINESLFKKVLLNINNFKNSDERESFAVETSTVAKEIRSKILDSVLVSPENLKMRIGI